VPVSLPDAAFDLPADLDGLLLRQGAFGQQLVELLELPL